jgi:prepilin peptidase CpaA
MLESLPDLLPDLLLCGVLLFCLYTDIKERRIYNKVILAAVIAGLLLGFLADGTTGLISAGKGFLLGAALLFLPFAAGGMGAGDLKLLAVIGLFKGAEFVFAVFLLAALLGGVFALALLLLRRRRGMMMRLKRIWQSISIPYAPFLVAASFIVHFMRQGG